MPSPTYRLLTAHFPSTDTSLAQQLTEDLRRWDFDPNETHENRLLGAQQPCSLLQAFLSCLPKTLTEKTALTAIALEIVDTLLQKGADPNVTDFHGNHVENLAPTPLRSRLIRAQGGDVQRDQALQFLKNTLSKTMTTNEAVITLKRMENEEGNAPHVLDHALVNWVLANGQQWSSRMVLNKDDTWTNGESGIARIRSAQVGQLISWAKKCLPTPQAELATFLGWCTAWGAAKADGSQGDHWDRLLLKLEPDDEAQTQRLKQADAYLSKDFGELTGHVMHSIAEACADFGDSAAGPLWVKAIGQLYARPGALDTAQKPGSDGEPFTLPFHWLSSILPRIRRGAPSPGTDYAQAWLSHLPAPMGTALIAQGMMEAHKAKMVPNQTIQQDWLTWAEHWLEAHPHQGMVLIEHLSRGNLNDGTHTKLKAWLMDLNLPVAENSQRKPRI